MKPKVFNNQREAFWYLQGIKDAKKSVDFALKQDIERCNLDYLDHLPEGEEDIKDNLDAGMGKSAFKFQEAILKELEND